MKIDPNATYDSETGELIVKGKFCEFGFCPNCSSPNWDPRKFKDCWFCRDCCVSRLEDCAKIVKNFDKLIEVQNADKKKFE